jgi:hypothetical protein
MRAHCGADSVLLLLVLFSQFCLTFRRLRVGFHTDALRPRLNAVRATCFGQHTAMIR